MRAKGFRLDHAIKVVELPNGKLGIVDGQHRMEGAKAAEIELAYTILKIGPEESLYDVAIQHGLMRAWVFGDYMNLYHQMGYKEYTKIADLAEQHGLKYPVAFSLLLAQRGHTTGQELKAFRRGAITFSKSDMNYAVSLLKRVDDIRCCHERLEPFKKDTGLLQALCAMVRHPRYDHKRMLAALAYQVTKIAKCGGAKDYLAMMEGIYNHKVVKPENRVDFLE